MSIQIRIAEKKDIPKLLEIYKPYVEYTAITFEYEVPTKEEFAIRMENVLKRFPYLVAEKNGRILGYAYAGPFKERAAYDWAVETSIYVKRTEMRKGVGKLLYHALEKVLKAQGILNVNACIAYPECEDEYLTMDSVNFHEHLGYKSVGIFHKCGYKYGRWYHMIWMEKMLGEHLENQPPVLPFTEKIFLSVKEESDFDGKS